MASLEKKNFNEPDETRNVGRMRTEQITIGGLLFTRNTAAPGWRWSEDIKPVAKTDSCQMSHIIQLLSGKIIVRLDDGTEMVFNPGDTGVIPPGHDGWTVGNEPAVWIELPH
jgi:hypothetical protein